MQRKNEFLTWINYDKTIRDYFNLFTNKNKAKAI